MAMTPYKVGGQLTKPVQGPELQPPTTLGQFMATPGFGGSTPPPQQSLGQVGGTQVGHRNLSQGNVTYVRRIPPMVPTGPRMLDQAAGFAFNDVNNAQRIEALNRTNNNLAIGGVGDRLGDITAQRLGGLADADQILQGDVERSREQGGDDLATFDRNAQDTIQTADKWANAADQTGRDAVAGMEDRRAQDMAAAMFSMKSRMRDEEAMSGANPDGTMKTPAQLNSEKMQRQEQYHQEIASMQTQIASMYNQGLSQVRQALANVQLNAGSLAAGTRQNLTMGRLDAEAGRRDYEKLAAATNSLRANLKVAGLGSALQDELAGRMALAQMKIDNPYSLVSTFSAFAQLAALATAPGSQAIQGLQRTPQGGYNFGGTLPFNQRGTPVFA